MNASILKHVVDGDFSSFVEKIEEDVNTKVKEHLLNLKEKFPSYLAQELELAEKKEDEDKDEDKDEEDEDEEEVKGKKKGKKDKKEDEDEEDED